MLSYDHVPGQHSAKFFCNGLAVVFDYGFVRFFFPRVVDRCKNSVGGSG